MGVFLVSIQLDSSEECFGADRADQARPVNFDHMGLVWVPAQYLYLAYLAVVVLVASAVDTATILGGELRGAYFIG